MTSERQGEIFIFFETLLWAFFPVVTLLSFYALPNLLTLAWSTLFSALFFVPIIVYKKSWKEFINPLLWKYALGIVLFIGVLFYGFYFVGLSKTTPGNASIIAVFEVFTSFLFFNFFRKEAFSSNHKVGSCFMVLGACVVLAPNVKGVNPGDFFVLLATFCAPAGNMYQQKAKQIASSETILFLRSLLSGIVLFIIAYFLGNTTHVSELLAALPYLLLNGLFVLGLSKLFWIEGIHRISVTKAISLNSMAPLFTLIIAWLFLHQAPTIWQLASLIPFSFGVLLLTNTITLNNKENVR